MQIKLYQIDAFTDKLFGGNPACVVPLNEWLADELLLNIAKENAVAETAFFVKQADKFQLRWFTPDIEMDLCGHATLAAAHALVTILNYKKKEIVFETISGELKVEVEGDLYHLNFPSRMPLPSALPEIIEKALSIQPVEVLKARDYLLVYNSIDDIQEIKIDRQIFDQINLDPGGLIVSAVGEDCDFVSRFFTPQSTILEDPVTGSAHCSLIPYWAVKLGKQELFAKQLSERGGELYCKYMDERVIIRGRARTYSFGHFWIE